MKVIKLGNGIKTNRHKCSDCGSLFSYTQYDIKKEYKDLGRIGIETSLSYTNEHILCPVCNKKIIFKSWTTED